MPDSAEADLLMGDLRDNPPNSPIGEALADTLNTPLNEEFYEKAATILEEAVAFVVQDLLEENAELHDMVHQMVLDKVFDQFTVGLTLFQKERLRNACVNVDLDPENPFEDWEAHLTKVKAAMFPSVPSDTGFEAEGIEPEFHGSAKLHDPSMAVYNKTAGWLAGKR